MDFGRAFSFYFKDDRWFRKVLAPAACQIVPLLGLAAAAGWGLEICRRVIRKNADELPAMNLRRNIPDGIAVLGIGLACSLPVVLWLCAAGLLSALAFPGGRGGAPLAFDSFWWGAEFIAAAGIAAAAMGMTAAAGRFAETGSFREAVRIRKAVSEVRSAPRAYLQVVLAWFPLGLLAAAGIAVCGAGILFTTAYALGSAFHAAGQAHLLATLSRGRESGAPEA